MAAVVVPEKIMSPSPPPSQHMHLSPPTSRRSTDTSSGTNASPDRRSSLDLPSSSTSSPSRLSDAQVTISIDLLLDIAFEVRIISITLQRKFLLWFCSTQITTFNFQDFFYYDEYVLNNFPCCGCSMVWLCDRIS